MFPIFDLDGTLLDTDAALVAAFVALGVPAEAVTFGHVLDEECERFGISLDDYIAAYDPDVAVPFPGVAELIASLPRWAVCSNKHPGAGMAELARLGWRPEVALFSDAFGGGSKRLEPVLDALALRPSEALFVGDTEHDLRCAVEAGVRFALAGWNPRARSVDVDVVLERPEDLRSLLVVAGA